MTRICAKIEGHRQRISRSWLFPPTSLPFKISSSFFACLSGGFAVCFVNEAWDFTSESNQMSFVRVKWHLWSGRLSISFFSSRSIPPHGVPFFGTGLGYYTKFLGNRVALSTDLLFSIARENSVCEIFRMPDTFRRVLRYGGVPLLALQQARYFFSNISRNNYQ